MNLTMHPAYEQLVAKARGSHERGRSSEGITQPDIALARLYCYALRMHTIGAYHATRSAIEKQPPSHDEAMAHRRRACDALRDLADEGMNAVPRDFRAVVSTLHRYDLLVHRVLDSLQQDHYSSGDERIAEVSRRFSEIISEITACNGIHLTRDTEAPRQASFVVPNLGITIVPLVYGDHHSWNLAYLQSETGQPRDVPVHRHREGVEIHLGYEPIEGTTILGNCFAQVTEGYAMPIPPQTDHGFVNASSTPHHVPFIFGSLKQAGWGVFLDVEPREVDLNALQQVPVESEQMNGTVYLGRELAAAATHEGPRRRTLIAASRMDRNGSGGLELAVARIDAAGFRFPPAEHFRIVSVVRGSGTACVAGIERNVNAHDHFGIPAAMEASLRSDNGPMLTLDAMIGPA